MQKMKCTAILLAAGQGKRMQTKVHKQYLEIAGKPMLYYSLRAFEEAAVIDDVIIVVGEGQIEFCRQEIVSKYGFAKVRKIVEGGKERYHSVWQGLQEISGDGYVFIHDGARPFVTEEILNRAYQEVLVNKSCVVGMPVKDTIKLCDRDDFVAETPDRSCLWMVQTPQVFETELVKRAYGMLMQQEHIRVTDDAMVVEQMLGQRVKLICGSYKNIKVTTPEDILIANAFVQK